MLDTKSASTPEVVGNTLSITNGDLFPDSHLYRNTVGVFQYVTFTRPNILFFVNKACQFMANPTITHWLAVKRILRYLEGTFTHGILIHAVTSLDVHDYTDVDWASCPDDRHNTGGYCLFLGPNLISWSYTKQKVVSYSCAESEYRAFAFLTAKITWYIYHLSTK